MNIHVNLTGRLGNQLFQYACARQLQKKYGGTIICNTYELNHITEHMTHIPGKFSYAMKNLLLDKRITLEEKKIPWYANFLNPIIRILKKICPIKLFNFGIQRGCILWQRSDYIEIPELKKDSILINGWWQDIRFFDNIQGELKKEIVPTFDVLSKNKKLLCKIQNENSVCISVRGGNYLDPKVKKLLFVCDKYYFYNAIRTIVQQIDKPVFFIFSDDLDWVREYINFEQAFPEYTFFYEDGDDPVEEKLRLMKSCKHFIISNSTFSWWAQYLGDFNKKIVIAPNKWYVDGRRCGLYMKNWQLIDVDRNSR